METVHPIQITATSILLAADIIGLALLNKYKLKQQQRKQKHDWTFRRNSFWLLIAFLVSIAMSLDYLYPTTNAYFMPIKSYVFAFPLGLLDLYYADIITKKGTSEKSGRNNGVSMKVIPGAALWCSSVILRQIFLDLYYGEKVETSVILTNFTISTPLIEMARYIFGLIGVGFLSDLLFSPMHRLAHHPKTYKFHHKEHHEYTNNLTALVLYHGALLDDFLMPFTTTIGGLLYIILLKEVFGVDSKEAFSNFTGYIMVYNTLLSHAHDIKCATLLAPLLPDSLNFIAYHFCHHISPSNNYGLTEPSDVLWDWILGVKTIVKYGDMVEQLQQQNNNEGHHLGKEEIIAKKRI